MFELNTFIHRSVKRDIFKLFISQTGIGDKGLLEGARKSPNKENLIPFFLLIIIIFRFSKFRLTKTIFEKGKLWNGV